MTDRKQNEGPTEGGQRPVEQTTFFSDGQNGAAFHEMCEALGCNGNAPGWPDEFGNAVARYLREINAPKIRTLSLFSGAGGLDIGFSDVGFDIVESVEIERKFCDTLESNTGKGKQFEHTTVRCADIRTFSGQNLGKIDFMIGGPPCQTFSAAGRRANGVLGTTDARGVLFREYVRLLRELSPVGFLFENVYGIVGAQGGAAWKEIRESFAEAGYQIYDRIVDAADYGVPQHRERLLIVGLKESAFQFPRPTHGPDSIDGQPFYSAGTAVSGAAVEEPITLGGRYGPLLNAIPPGLNYSFYTEKMGHPHPIFAWRSKFSDFLYKADPDVPVRTIKAAGGAYTGPFHWENRLFSEGEFKRLQSFPDDYEISGSRQTAIKQIGNSVPPQLARVMAIAIRQQVFQTQFPFRLSLLREEEELSFRKRKRELTKRYQQRAREAIAELEPTVRPGPVSREYFCKLSSDFAFQELGTHRAEYSVSVSWDTSLCIQIRQVYGGETMPHLMHLEIHPSGQWVLPADHVSVDVYASDAKGFTVAWKAFEKELSENAIKADLVQLNGYYQYAPELRCACTLNCDFPYRDILESIVAGKNVAQILPEERIETAWGVAEDEVVEVAKFLRMLGYEVRNHSTNPQIEDGSWLIPYAFPTLTPLSVQLRKRVQ